MLQVIISNRESKMFFKFSSFLYAKRILAIATFPEVSGSRRLTGRPVDATPDSVQIAKSVYSGFTGSVGADNMPAPTVAFEPCSIKMKEPVSRFVL